MIKIRNIEELKDNLIEGTISIAEGKIDYHSDYIDDMLNYCKNFINNKEKLQDTKEFSEVCQSFKGFINAVRNKGSELMLESTSGCDFDLVDQRSTFIEKSFKKVSKTEMNAEMGR